MRMSGFKNPLILLKDLKLKKKEVTKMTMTDLTLEQKQQILMNGFDECMKHHLCGNYISMSDVDGLEDSDIEWFVNTDSLQMVALTDFGTFHHQYDYDFSFDDNLNTFVEGLQDFLMSEIENTRDE